MFLFFYQHCEIRTLCKCDNEVEKSCTVMALDETIKIHENFPRKASPALDEVCCITDVVQSVPNTFLEGVLKVVSVSHKRSVISGS
jgi:hypothetical protein